MSPPGRAEASAARVGRAARLFAALAILATLSGCPSQQSITFPEERTTPPGFVHISVSTTGDDPDSDGYELHVNEGVTQPVAANGSVTISGLPPGFHQVTLTGVAPHCTVQSANPQSFTIVSGATVDVSFQVHCP